MNKSAAAGNVRHDRSLARAAKKPYKTCRFFDFSTKSQRRSWSPETPKCFKNQQIMRSGAKSRSPTPGPRNLNENPSPEELSGKTRILEKTTCPIS